MCSWNWVRVVLNETPQIAQGKVQMFCLQEAFWRAICYLSVYNSPWVQSSLWENLGSASRAINGMLTTDWLYIPCVWCRPAPLTPVSVSSPDRDKVNLGPGARSFPHPRVHRELIIVLLWHNVISERRHTPLQNKSSQIKSSPHFTRYVISKYRIWERRGFLDYG